MDGTAGLSEAARDALGYVGGGILALSLVPQIIKLLMTRSAADISLMWSLLYLLGTSLSLVYLVILGALAAWIPVCVEVLGCFITITLKLLYDHTDWGIKQQQLLLELDHPSMIDGEKDASQQPLCSRLLRMSSQQQSPQDHPEQQQQQQQLQKQKSHQKLSASEHTQQLMEEQQQQLPQPSRQRTKKRVIVNAPMTAAEAAEAAAAVNSGDVVLTVGVQLPATVISSAATSLAPSPRGDGSGVIFYDDNKPLPKIHSAASMRRIPWYLQTGISHHSVLSPASPRVPLACNLAQASIAAAPAVAVATAYGGSTPAVAEATTRAGPVLLPVAVGGGGGFAAAPRCCHACGAAQQPVPQLVTCQSGRAWTNLLFSPRAGSQAGSDSGTPAGAAPTTPKGQWSPFRRSLQLDTSSSGAKPSPLAAGSQAHMAISVTGVGVGQ